MSLDVNGRNKFAQYFNHRTRRPNVVLPAILEPFVFHSIKVAGLDRFRIPRSMGGQNLSDAEFLSKLPTQDVVLMKLARGVN